MFHSPEIQSISKPAGLTFNVWETNRPGHAREMVKQLDLVACDALVTVGPSMKLGRSAQSYRPEFHLQWCMHCYACNAVHLVLSTQDLA